MTASTGPKPKTPEEEAEDRRIRQEQHDHAQQLDYATSLHTLAAVKQAQKQAFNDQDVRIRYIQISGPNYKPPTGASSGISSQPAMAMTQMFGEGLWRADEATVPPGSAPRYLMKIDANGKVTTITHPVGLWEKFLESKFGPEYKKGIHGQQSEIFSQQIDILKDQGVKRIKLDFELVDPNDPQPIEKFITKKMLDKALKTAEKKGTALAYGDNVNQFIEYLERAQKGSLPVSDPTNKNVKFATWTEYYENERRKLDAFYPNAELLTQASANYAFKKQADELKKEQKLPGGALSKDRMEAYENKIFKKDGTSLPVSEKLDVMEKEVDKISKRLQLVDKAKEELEKNFKASDDLIKSGKVKEAHALRKLGKKNRKMLFEELKVERQDLREIKDVLSKELNAITIVGVTPKDKQMQEKQKKLGEAIDGIPPTATDPGKPSIQKRLDKLDDTIRANNKVVKDLKKQIPRKTGRKKAGVYQRKGPGSSP